MSNKTAATSTATRTTTDDPNYAPFLRGVADTFALHAENVGALFTVDTEGLWELYLQSFPEAERQTYNCSACRQFVERFGGLVVIRHDGARFAACWHAVTAPDAPETFRHVAERLYLEVSRRPVVGVFISKEPVLGTPATGPWTHLSVTVPDALLHRDRLRTPGQVAAAVRENVATVERALEEFSADALREALRILEADALSRSEKFVGPVKWLLDLHTARAEVKDERRRSAILWRAVATSPEGYSHPRASVIGPLLEGIAAGKSYETLRAEFAAMLHPLRYQRPTAAPSAGNIAEAERIVAQLGIARSLERRFARLDECETLWKPTAPPPRAPNAGGVFAHLTPKDVASAVAGLHLPAQTMTWDKFSRAVLPTAEAIALLVPSPGPFIALVTATNADAPPIIRWDREDRRNPVTWYVYHRGSPAGQWGIEGGKWRAVTGVVPFPNLWGDRPAPQHSDGVVLVLDGAVDSRDAGCALFPENLRDDLRAIRSTVEAFSNAAVISGREQASACGYDLRKGQGRIDVALRVTVGGRATDYRIDRWD
ncbi:MAG: hypothetical protein JWM41_866 [Gemmatimonadetes bacterium]|nr:hypothetical protein [Gemmatimonadota bacterium]